jgi:hypothetical protein
MKDAIRNLLEKSESIVGETSATGDDSSSSMVGGERSTQRDHKTGRNGCLLKAEFRKGQRIDSRADRNLSRSVWNS